MNKLDTLIQEFAQEITSIIRQDVIQELVSGVKPAKANGKAPKQLVARMVPLGGKRTAEELEKLKDKIIAFVQKNPGARSETIQNGLVMSPEALQLPLKQLVTEKVLKGEGIARGRKYTVR